jgi:NAD(P)-dependent dehydrogenase (short-subunit alcohol dehydrogenase family)
MDLKGKRAVVTGASKGIGLAIAEGLLDGGCQVANWSRGKAGIYNSQFHDFTCDVTDSASVEEAAKSSLEWMGGGVDILINNAGIGRYGTLAETSLSEWKQIFDVNVHGVFHCLHALLPAMGEGGHIVNIASLAGKNGIPGLSGYCGSKFALRGISQALFQELRPRGIKVTCLFPGSVRTSIFDDMPGMAPPTHPLEPQDVADAVLDCLSASANNLISELDIRPFRPKG